MREDSERYSWGLRYGNRVALLFTPILLIAYLTGLFKSYTYISLIICVTAYIVYNHILDRRYRSHGPSNFLNVLTLLGGFFFLTVGVYASSTLMSPLLFLYGPLAAATGIFLHFRQGVIIDVIAVTLLEGLVLLEYSGLIPHVPLFSNGSDPGLYRQIGYVIAIPILVLAHMLALSYGAHYLVQRLREREKELETQEQKRWVSLGQFSAVVAHEVKNPLAGIKGAARLIEKAKGLDSVRELARDIGGEVERLDRLVNQYLDFASPHPIVPRLISLDDVVERAVAFAKTEPADGAQSIQMNLGADLPQINADPDQLYEALLNLIKNAMEAVGKSGNITVTTHLSGRFIEIEIADSGPGIPPNVMPRIFEPFFTTKVKGSGIGLAVVQRIIQGHGGTIQAANRTAGGAVFTVRLPEVKP